MKFNWGHGIALAIGAFMAMILFFVYDSFNHKTALVATDYYAQEVNYQQKIDKIKNAEEFKLITRFTSEGLVIQLPRADVKGKIQLFRPSDANLDFEVKIATDTLGKQLIGVDALKAGFWRAKVEWTDRGKVFYSETSFIAP